MNKAKRSKKKGTPDIYAVARLAKVSIATVSRTINKVPTVDPKLAQRVWKAVDKLGFSPNTQARALVSGRSHLLGLIVSEITNPFYPEMVQGFQDFAVESGYEVLIGTTNYDPRRMELCVQRMLERKVDGVALMTFSVEDQLLEQLAEGKIPLAFVGAYPTESNFSTIEVDYYNGIREGVQYLAVLGHRKIGFISGPLHSQSSAARKLAFTKAMDGIGLPMRDEWMPEGNHTPEGGIAATKRILAGRELPTAIMTSNDMTAFGVLRALFDAGLRVPDDVSVIGFDDVSMAQFTLPPLTSVQMSPRELARCAVMALRDRLEQEHGVKPAHYKVQTKLTVRQSAGAPRQESPAKKGNPANNGVQSSSRGPFPSESSVQP
ncbi:MAG TPA: LacI family DNA-binding transcriptional regulator [Acidobacteriaceae bacterium]|nr:LacI family DNA-binding transcriptional regulator [Acidobacteriaceae bacterium]